MGEEKDEGAAVYIEKEGEALKHTRVRRSWRRREAQGVGMQERQADT